MLINFNIISCYHLKKSLKLLLFFTFLKVKKKFFQMSRFSQRNLDRQMALAQDQSKHLSILK